MFSQGVPPPFVLTTSIPRMHLSLLKDGNSSISGLNLGNSLVMIEEGDDESIDEFLDCLQLDQEVCCLLIDY